MKASSSALSSNIQVSRFKCSLTQASWFLVAYLGLVILWGAFVRCTGSGAGCGDHWPLCNGEVVPMSKGLKTWIEWIHRLTSLFAWVLSIVLARKVFKTGSAKSKFYLKWGFFFLTLETLVGASLVLLGLVGQNQSMTRAWIMGFHLINTILLMGSFSLVARFVDQTKQIYVPLTRSLAWVGFFTAVTFLLVAASGAMNALGDTLFPTQSLVQGIAADFDRKSHLLIRLRIFHPMLACLCVVFLTVFGVMSKKAAAFRSTDLLIFSRFLIAFAHLQILLGFLNLYFLAPVYLQLLHLGLANVIGVVLTQVFAGLLWTEEKT